MCQKTAGLGDESSHSNDAGIEKSSDNDSRCYNADLKYKSCVFPRIVDGPQEPLS